MPSVRLRPGSVRLPRPGLPRLPGAVRRRVGSRGAAALVLVLALGLGWLVLGSGLFVVRFVEVTGAHRLDPVAVRAAAGLRSGRPLALVDPAAVRARVARLPLVGAVRVQVTWPRSVRIAVTERAPLLAVPVAGGYRLVDVTGTAFTTSPTRPPGVPLVALATPGSADRATRAAVDVLTSLPAPIRARLARLEAPTGDAVTLVLRDSRRVLWGSGDRSTQKAAALAALLPHRGRVYDVSAPDVVTIAR